MGKIDNACRQAERMQCQLGRTYQNVKNAKNQFNYSKWTAVAFGTISVIALGAIFGGCIPNVSILKNFSHLAVQNIPKACLTTSLGVSGGVFLASSANMIRIYSKFDERKKTSKDLRKPTQQGKNSNTSQEIPQQLTKRRYSRSRSNSPVSSGKSMQVIDIEPVIKFIDNGD